MAENKERKILQSWIANSGQWIQTVQRGEIPSRALATNQAIVDAVVAQQPENVLDVGCGEGWLCRALTSHGIQSWGVDGAPALIDEANAHGKGTFCVQDYSDMISRGLSISRTFDVIVFNFSLFGKTSSADLIATLKHSLTPQGKFVIQTLHPASPSIDHPGVSGWRHESWGCMQRPYSAPYQWYYRNLEDWHALFLDGGLRIEETRDIHHPQTQMPVSVIFIVANND